MDSMRTAYLIMTRVNNITPRIQRGPYYRMQYVSKGCVFRSTQVDAINALMKTLWK